MHKLEMIPDHNKLAVTCKLFSLPRSKCCNLIADKVKRYRDHDTLRCQDDIS